MLWYDMTLKGLILFHNPLFFPTEKRTFLFFLSSLFVQNQRDEEVSRAYLSVCVTSTRVPHSFISHIPYSLATPLYSTSTHHTTLFFWVARHHHHNQKSQFKYFFDLLFFNFHFYLKTRHSIVNIAFFNMLSAIPDVSFQIKKSLWTPLLRENRGLLNMENHLPFLDLQNRSIKSTEVPLNIVAGWVMVNYMNLSLWPTTKHTSLINLLGESSLSSFNTI